jgi:selenocysteine lyase/cysteine desulfurase
MRRLGADFTVQQFAACMGDDIAVGALRASPGIASNAEDVDRIVDVVASFAGRSPRLSPNSERS